MRWQVYHLARLVGKVVRFHHRGPTDELRPFIKSGETSMDLATDSTALLSGIRQMLIWVCSLEMLGVRMTWHITSLDSFLRTQKQKA